MVHPIIMNSWQRCKMRFQNPEVALSRMLSDKELKKKKQENINLIRVAKPFLEELYQFVKGSGFVVLLLDEQACVLEIMGDQDIIKKGKYFRLGESWDEETKGTNAMGIVTIEKIPAQVYATEHYIKSNHSITCSAAPIKGVNGEMIGMLDLSGDCTKAHAHTLGMVVAAVKAIERELQLEAANSEIIKSYNNVKAIIENISEGIVSFDQNGYITKMNPVALNILDMAESNFRGKKLKNIINNEEVIDRIFKLKQSVSDHEVLLKNNGQHIRFLLSAQPIIDNKKELCGGVAVIKEIRNVHRLINKIVGAKALFTFEDIIGQSKAITNSIKIAQDVAQSMSTVYLQGESGTGKEMFAQAIHNSSNLERGPFVAVNCSAIPRDLIESELFGYEDGAFTGASRGGRAGKFELANDGTIFLDEIGDMPLETQISLLRVLQERQVVRIGGYKPIPLNVRVITATNKDLKEEVRKGNFRNDLYYRLNVIKILIPPLREREGDISLLAEYYIQKFSNMFGLPIVELDHTIKNSLENYYWPGNVRELSNAIERSVNLAKGKEIKLEHLPEQLLNPLEAIKKKYQDNDTLEELEKELIIKTLQSLNWNISKCSEILGIARNTLYRKINKYQIIIPNY